MTAAHSQALSRPMSVAQELQGKPVDESVVLSRLVVLTGEHKTLATPNGAWCLLNSMRLLSRIAGRLRIVLPAGLGPLEEDVGRLARALWRAGSIEVTHEGEPACVTNAHAVLSVGTVVPNDSHWTTINSNGWLARVSSVPGSIAGNSSQSNPLGAILAAALGATEVFKRVYGIALDKAPLLEATEFSLFDLGTSSPSPGPELPAAMHLPDTLLVGAGAIGNAIALLMMQLRLRGRLHIVDKQDFAEENLGTCMLLDDRTWLHTSKAQQLAQVLNGGHLRCSFEQALIADAVRGNVLHSMTTELVLNALDDVEARREAQLLWPSVLVDGGINAVGAAVRVHRLDRPRWACMRCGFRQAVASVEALQSQVSGLSAESLRSDHGRQLSDEDIAAAQAEMRPWLLEQRTLGRTVCATIAEAQARQVGMDVAPGFRPSAPFVAAMSAALVMAEALKALYFKDRQTVQHFQVESIFIGPASGTKLVTNASPACECSVHRPHIDEIAARRASRSTSKAGS